MKKSDSALEDLADSAASLRYNPQEISILLIKHSEPMRDVTSYVLQALGFADVMGCDSFEEAQDTLTVAQSDSSTMDVQKIDLIVTDWALSEGDGLAFAEWIRGHKNERISSLPIIALVAGSDEEIAQAREKGVNEILMKPVSVVGWMDAFKHITAFPFEKAEASAPDFSAEVQKAAQKQVDDFAKYAPKMMGRTLEAMDAVWDKMSKMKPSSKRKELAEKIYFQADELSDVAAVCGYMLMSDFAGSLRDYVRTEKTDVKAQRVILQAQMDVIHTAFKQKIKDGGGEVAEQLKAAVQKAIRQND